MPSRSRTMILWKALLVAVSAPPPLLFDPCSHRIPSASLICLPRSRPESRFSAALLLGSPLRGTATRSLAP